MPRSSAWSWFLVCKSIADQNPTAQNTIEHKSETFTLYFLAFDHSNGKDSAEVKQKTRLTREGDSSLSIMSRQTGLRYTSTGILELTHNHGTESDSNFAGYASGNSDPGRGFGHIAISVDNIEEACARLEKLGVKFQKKLTDGKMRHIAFILDPDG